MFQKRVLPIVYITQTLNYFRTRKIIRKIERFGKVNIAALGILVDIPNHAPVQAERIYETLKKLRNDICVPIVGFTQSHVSPGTFYGSILESYYVLSAADRIYTSPTAIFNLKRANYLETAVSN